MKAKKTLALALASAMACSLAACGSGTSSSQAASESTASESTASTATDATAASDVTDYGGITLTMMNSKPEIQDALEEITAAWGEEHNVNFEVYETDAPGDMLAQRYAAGDPPVLAICDPTNVSEMGEEKFLDLSGEDWVADGGDTMGTKVNDVLYGFPLCVEAPGMVYNKTAIENILGREFVPADYATIESFSALLEELRAGGMENPVIVNQEDWALGGQLLRNLYVLQDGTADGAYQFIKDVQAGASLLDNQGFQDLFKDYDLFIEYNINKDDPLAADYDLNASYVSEGEGAFWIGGSWVWPDMVDFVDDSMEYGIMPIPADGEAVSGKIFAYATKQIAVDKEVATAEQQAAALDFLDWLVYSEEGQDAMANKLEIVVAFTNSSLEPTNPLNVALKGYIDAGNTINNAPFAVPNDHTQEMAPHMQAYMVGQESLEQVADALSAYWSTRNPAGAEAE